MLDNLLTTRLYAAASREGLDLNDPAVQQKMFVRRQQIENMLCDFIAKQTNHCGCGKQKEVDNSVKPVVSNNGDKDENNNRGSR